MTLAVILLETCLSHDSLTFLGSRMGTNDGVCERGSSIINDPTTPSTLVCSQVAEHRPSLASTTLNGKPGIRLGLAAKDSMAMGLFRTAGTTLHLVGHPTWSRPPPAAEE